MYRTSAIISIQSAGWPIFFPFAKRAFHVTTNTSISKAQSVLVEPIEVSQYCRRVEQPLRTNRSLNLVQGEGEAMGRKDKLKQLRSRNEKLNVDNCDAGEEIKKLAASLREGEERMKEHATKQTDRVLTGQAGLSTEIGDVAAELEKIRLEQQLRDEEEAKRREEEEKRRIEEREQEERRRKEEEATRKAELEALEERSKVCHDSMLRTAEKCLKTSQKTQQEFRDVTFGKVLRENDRLKLRLEHLETDAAQRKLFLTGNSPQKAKPTSNEENSSFLDSDTNSPIVKTEFKGVNGRDDAAFQESILRIRDANARSREKKEAAARIKELPPVTRVTRSRTRAEGKVGAKGKKEG